MQKTAPGAVLAVATPVLDEGPAGLEARRIDLTNQPPLAAWKSIGLDLEAWQRDAKNLVLLRGVGPASDPLARDLGTHPDLDCAGGGLAQARAGSVSGSAGAREPQAGGVGPVAARRGEPRAGHGGRAAGACRGGAGCALGVAAGQLGAGSRGVDHPVCAGDPGLARSGEAAAIPLRAETGAAVRSWVVDGKTYLGLANDTPYTLRIDSMLKASEGEAAVDDLGRGWRLAPERPVAGGGSCSTCRRSGWRRCGWPART